MEFLGLIWDQGIMRPMINSLALLYHYLFLKLRSQHHRLHHCRARSHDSADGSTDQPNEEAAGLAASDEGNTGQIPRQKKMPRVAAHNPANPWHSIEKLASTLSDASARWSFKCPSGSASTEHYSDHAHYAEGMANLSASSTHGTLLARMCP